MSSPDFDGVLWAAEDILRKRFWSRGRFRYHLSQLVGNFAYTLLNDYMLKDSFFTESWYLPWIRIAKDEVFLDIGANLGFYARRIAPMAGIVIAFEPNPFVFRKLVARTASFRNVKCFQFAVGAADEKVELFLHEQVAGASVTRRSRDSVRVNSVCLDRFVDSNLIDSLRVGLVKIDVEGSEYDVMLGAETLLGFHKPRILLEIAGRSNLHRCRRFLDGLGYDSHLLKSYEEWEQWWLVANPVKH